MRKVPLTASLKIIARGTANWVSRRPIVVSFEVTDSCTCYCLHCDHGGPRDESKQLRPSDYKRYMDELQPCVVQISGGEPLMRKDLLEIVRTVTTSGGVPYTILVSNWSEMTESRYLELNGAGVDQFSVSLDFPDARHDDFRGYPGLYSHLEDVIPRVAKYGFDNIVLNSCITSANVHEINAMADKAREWGVNICYSSYSARRTGSKDYLLNNADLDVLRKEFAKVESRRDSTNWIVNSPSTLEATERYFTQRCAPGCKAGLRFLVVTANGELQACSMQFNKYPLEERDRIVEEFTDHNDCGECYVSIRSYLDKTFPQLLRENVGNYLSIGGGGRS